ncbi:MAG: 30S ribosomal protein S8 [Verrucomicrobiia bacterium]|jgi:small subunit ribosomal protein S8
MTDPISDMLTRIRNASRALLPEVQVQHSKLKENIARILKNEGYITDYSVQGDKVKTLTIKLKYQGKKPVIEGLKRVSKPGKRIYMSVDEIPRVRSGLGIAILTTSQGIMTNVEARKKNIGGELLCQIW